VKEVELLGKKKGSGRGSATEWQRKTMLGEEEKGDTFLISVVVVTNARGGMGLTRSSKKKKGMERR